MSTSNKYLRDGPESSSQKEQYLGTDESDCEDSDSSNNEPEYEVQQVLDKRVVKGEVQYLLKWVGYESSENSWEPIDIMSCDLLVAKFEETYGQQFKDPDIRDNIDADITYTEVFGDYKYKSEGYENNDSGIVSDLENIEEEDENNEEDNGNDNSEISEDIKDSDYSNGEHEDKAVEEQSADTETYSIDRESEEGSEPQINISNEILMESEEGFEEPETDENDSDVSYDFQSFPTIFDIIISESEEEVKEEVKEEDKEEDEEEEQISIENIETSFTSDSGNKTPVNQRQLSTPPTAPIKRKPQVLSIDDSDEEVIICETPRVKSLSFRRAKWPPRRRRQPKQTNLIKIPELVVLSDSDEESNQIETNNQILETAVENTMEDMIAQTVNDMTNEQTNSTQESHEITETNEKADGEDSDKSEGELVIDFNEEEDIEAILERGLIIDENCDEEEYIE